MVRATPCNPCSSPHFKQRSAVSSILLRTGNGEPQFRLESTKSGAGCQWELEEQESNWMGEMKIFGESLNSIIHVYKSTYIPI
jgi:hypothetical protein